jgi:hypothetical protein
MGKVKRTAAEFLIVLISFLCINGGRSMMLFSNNEQIVFTHDPVNDIEIPHQQHFANLADDEKWIGSLNIDFSISQINSVKFRYTVNSSTQEFPDSIWQPPKSI